MRAHAASGQSARTQRFPLFSSKKSVRSLNQKKKISSFILAEMKKNWLPECPSSSLWPRMGPSLESDRAHAANEGGGEPKHHSSDKKKKRKSQSGRCQGKY
jgi:hypothetical protein